MGYQIFGKREYYSNIKGEHSYFAVRVSDKQIRSSIKGTNMLIAFDAETIFRHANDVLENGIIIYDSTLENIKVSDVITFDNDFKERMEGFLKSKNKEIPLKEFWNWHLKEVYQYILFLSVAFWLNFLKK